MKGDAEGFCDRFIIEISVETDEPTETIEDLIRLAHRMCFTEKALLGNTKIEVIHRMNGVKLKVQTGEAKD